MDSRPDSARSAASKSCAIEERRVDAVRVVSVAGVVDMLTSPQLEKAITEAAKSSPAAVVVDMSAVEFLASAFVDLDYHAIVNPGELDVESFQEGALERIGMPKEIAMRHASPHFLHIFTGDGYSAGYYSYLWSEVLDADGFDAFKEKKDPFDPATAKKLHDYIYSAGGTRDFAEAYRLFRGRDPSIEPLLEGRGLAA